MERKITSISRIGDTLSVMFSDGEAFLMHKFGKDILTEVSDGVLKKTLKEFKKDVKKFDFNVQELTKIWVEEKYRKYGFE